MVIETTKKMNGGEKVVLVPHSMGAVFTMYFLKWVEAPEPQGALFLSRPLSFMLLFSSDVDSPV